MDPLKFKNEEQALQHLSDVTGKRIKVARMSKPPKSSSDKFDTFISFDDDNEPDVVVEFEYEQGSPGSRDEPSYDGYISLISVTRKDNKQDVLEQLNADQTKELEQLATEYLDNKLDEDQAAYDDYLHDQMKDGEL